MISGLVQDDQGMPIYDADVDVYSANDTSYSDYTYSNDSGYYSIEVPAGVYDINVYADGFFSANAYEVDVSDDVNMDFTLMPASGFTGGVQGIVSFAGDSSPESAYINVYNDT